MIGAVFIQHCDVVEILTIVYLKVAEEQISSASLGRRAFFNLPDDL